MHHTQILGLTLGTRQTSHVNMPIMVAKMIKEQVKAYGSTSLFVIGKHLCLSNAELKHRAC